MRWIILNTGSEVRKNMLCAMSVWKLCKNIDNVELGRELGRGAVGTGSDKYGSES